MEELMDVNTTPFEKEVNDSTKKRNTIVGVIVGVVIIALLSTIPFILSSKTKPPSTHSPTQTPVPTETPTASPTAQLRKPSPTIQPQTSQLKHANVLVLEYFPRDANNPDKLDAGETGWSDATAGPMTIADWERNTQIMVEKITKAATDATRYHGYKDASAPAYITYSVLDTKKFYTAIPRGTFVPWNPKNSRPNYGQIMKDQNICDLVDNKNVKEVWMFGYHHDGTIEPDESRMSSKYGDISNSGPKEEQTPPEFRMPICKNSYVLYNFTYQPGSDPGVGNPIHNRGHQIENAIGYTDYETFWHNFSERSDSKVHNFDSACGNIHFAPNWRTDQDGYGYSIQDYRKNNCETWDPDKSKTTYVNANCNQWGCTDIGFYVWWMQNNPGYQNKIVYQGKQMRNWWDAMYDFNEFVDKGRTLYE